MCLTIHSVSRLLPTPQVSHSPKIKPLRVVTYLGYGLDVLKTSKPKFYKSDLRTILGLRSTAKASSPNERFHSSPLPIPHRSNIHSSPPTRIIRFTHPLFLSTSSSTSCLKNMVVQHTQNANVQPPAPLLLPMRKRSMALASQPLMWIVITRKAWISYWTSIKLRLLVCKLWRSRSREPLPPMQPHQVPKVTYGMKKLSKKSTAVSVPRLLRCQRLRYDIESTLHGVFSIKFVISTEASGH